MGTNHWDYEERFAQTHAHRDVRDLDQGLDRARLSGD
jgi:hypothetical protein